MLRRLALCAGTVVSRDALMGSMCGDRDPADWPESKLVDVHVCRLRAKVSAFGVTIRGKWGQGYVLTCPDGFVWPWAGAEARA